MNRDDAKNILLLHRPGAADANDPQVVEALSLAQRDEEVARWFGEHCARQEILRAKFRQISPPPALKEQIIFEQIAQRRANSRRQTFVAVAAVVAIVAALIVLAPLWLPRRPAPPSNTLADYEQQMVSVATIGYAMDLKTNEPTQIRDYLAKNHAPADYTLPAGLGKAALAGCTVENWQNTKTSLICFRTGKPLPPNSPGDLWLFIVDRASVKDAPDGSAPQFTAVNGIATAIWNRDGKLYLLATPGDEAALQKYL